MKQLRSVITRLADGAVTGDSRDQYNEQYALLNEQIGNFIDDAFYNGRTLLSIDPLAGGGDITSIRNETGEDFTIEAVDGEDLKMTTLGPLDEATDAAPLIQAGGEFELVDAAISTALNKFGAQMQYVDNQIVYNSKKIDAMNDGLGALVDADLAKALMSINAVKGVEIGDGFGCVSTDGRMAADEMVIQDGTAQFLSNHAGGILGGISTGQEIIARIAVKPTSSILTERRSMTESGENVMIRTKGRHDPCVGIRAVPVAEAMMACVLLDHVLKHRAVFGKGEPQ
jgi:hypothetical protein